ncbi:IclR family transcriptional regulator [Arthrobacter sp. TS-15]|uniref:IclR family transcriptional regulator n=1 Tax=Arthrobacter sp. TS-15 TaxID=2510797 RepID=UPI00115CBBA0|nr:IclR family transcriptional regulator [Arthrobacter sp. TS-15]
MSSTERDSPPTASIERISAILECFSHDAPELSVSEVARRAGLPKSTTSRWVSALVAHRFLEQHDRRLSLGLRFFELGEQAVRPQSLRRLTYAQMEGLRRATGHTVHLAVLDGRHVVYIQILPTRGTPALRSRVGGRILAHATGVGKALLAFSPLEVSDKYIAEGLPKVGPKTITQPDELRAALWRTRAQGFSTEDEESGPGVACVAAPIVVDDSAPLAALSVAGDRSALDIASCSKAIVAAVESLRRQATHLPPNRLTL